MKWKSLVGYIPYNFLAHAWIIFASVVGVPVSNRSVSQLATMLVFVHIIFIFNKEFEFIFKTGNGII